MTHAHRTQPIEADIARASATTEEDIPYLLIFRAMVASLGESDDIREKFNMPESTVKVEMNVNGIPVDVIAALAETWKQMDNEVNMRAQQIAINILMKMLGKVFESSVFEGE